MSDRLKSFTFALIMCLICSALLTVASTALKSAQEQNRQTDQKKNILKAVGLIDPDADNTPAMIDRLYADRITRLAVDNTGTITEGGKNDSDLASKGVMPIYLSMDAKKQIESYILPIASKGLWGMIYGYLALEKDGSTIKGFTVYRHSETPGLGGEIENAWFQKNFVGKKIVDHNNQFVSISITKGKASDIVAKTNLPNYVDGISGATLTGKYLTQGLREVLSEYEPASIRFRQNVFQCRMQFDASSKVPGCENEK